MTASETILVAQVVASGVMCGIIWFVQLVHYPLFARIPQAEGVGYAREHQQRTARLVLPPMIVEGSCAVALAMHPPPGIGRTPTVFGLAIVAVLWGSTLLLQMPAHRRLANTSEDTAYTIRTLVRTNWIRTALWTTRLLLAVWMVRAAA